jgi:hypothetical protein
MHNYVPRQKPLSLLSLGLHLVFVIGLGTLICVTPRVPAFAMMPTPGPQDEYLIGVKRVVIAAGTALQPELISRHDLPAVDYSKIEEDAVEQFEKTLPTRTFKSVIFETAPVNDKQYALGKLEPEDTLLIDIRIGYRFAKTANGEMPLGAVFTTVSRSLPGSLISARSSGFHAGLSRRSIPYPFIVSELPSPTEGDLKNAVRQSVGEVIDWVNHTPLSQRNKSKTHSATKRN